VHTDQRLINQPLADTLKSASTTRRSNPIRRAHRARRRSGTGGADV